MPQPIHDSATRISALRAVLSARKLDAWIQPINDEFQGEYVPEYAQRLPWISGFSGSAGMGIVSRETISGCALLVDGRYTVQAQKQVDNACWQIANSGDVSPIQWLGNALSSGANIALDAWLHTHAQVKKWNDSLATYGMKLSALRENLIDAVWADKPEAPTSEIIMLPDALTGKKASAKIADMVAELTEKKLAAFVITQPDAVCWLLNIRASDIPFNPLLLSYALVLATGQVVLLTHARDFSPDMRMYFAENNVATHQFSEWFESDALAKHYGLSQAKLGIDPALSAHAWWLWAAENSVMLVEMDDPTLLAKACKNDTEQAGMRIAHHKDAVAIVRFLSALPTQSPERMPNELVLTAQLEAQRQRIEQYRGASFATIAGSGAHGAIVHYHATQESNRTPLAGELLLLDSGGQYVEGTTDITRTLAIGIPNDEMKDRFTRVLKGHIALASARFVRGTSGRQLDTLARQYLWEVGLDYDHGTGHGVGSFLCVHEGPQRISKKGSDIALAEGMVVSNEPGYYKTGEYGIRIENLVMVVATDIENILAFETLTLVPIDTSLIARELLRADEIAWLDAYHVHVWNAVTPLLADDVARTWLKQACSPII